MPPRRSNSFSNANRILRNADNARRKGERFLDQNQANIEANYAKQLNGVNRQAARAAQAFDMLAGSLGDDVSDSDIDAVLAEASRDLLASMPSVPTHEPKAKVKTKSRAASPVKSHVPRSENTTPTIDIELDYDSAFDDMQLDPKLLDEITDTHAQLREVEMEAKHYVDQANEVSAVLARPLGPQPDQAELEAELEDILNEQPTVKPAAKPIVKSKPAVDVRQQQINQAFLMHNNRLSAANTITGGMRAIRGAVKDIDNVYGTNSSAYADKLAKRHAHIEKKVMPEIRRCLRLQKNFPASSRSTGNDARIAALKKEVNDFKQDMSAYANRIKGLLAKGAPAAKATTAPPVNTDASAHTSPRPGRR